VHGTHHHPIAQSGEAKIQRRQQVRVRIHKFSSSARPASPIQRARTIRAA
jgi:hypothetical protein